MEPELLSTLEDEKPGMVLPSRRVRLVRRLNVFISLIVVIALCLGALLLFTHPVPQTRGNRTPQTGVHHSPFNPLPALKRPPTLLNQQDASINDDLSDHEIPTFALDQSAVYATDGLHSVYALQSNSGQQLWRIAENDLVGWSVLADQRTLYTIASPPEGGRGIIKAWDTGSGSLLWSRTLWGPTVVGGAGMNVSAPLAIANGVLYICASPGAGDYKVYAIRATDGAPLWLRDFDSGMLPEPVDRITVVDGVIYFSSSEGTLVALRASDGSPLWDGPAGVNSLPTVANGIVYLSTNTQYDLGPHVDDFAAVSAATGKTLWHYKLQGGPSGSAIVSGNTVYIGSDENRVYAFDAHSGTLKWSSEMNELHALPRNDDQHVFVGAVSANTVLVGSEDGYVMALQADNGALRWYYQTDGLYTAPTVTRGDLVYMQSDSPHTAVVAMSALRISSGKVFWKTSLGRYMGPTVAATPTPGIAPHLPGIPSFTVEDVKQYLKTHTFPGLDTTGTPTITFTDYKDALGLVGITEGPPGVASAPYPQDKQLVCIVIWRSTYYDQARQKEMKNTSYVIFSADTGVIKESGSSGGPA